MTEGSGEGRESSWEQEVRVMVGVEGMVGVSVGCVVGGLVG